MENLDDEKNVAEFLYDMLTKLQMHKENEVHVHEDVEVDNVVAHGNVVNNQYHALEDVKARGKGVNEIRCTTNNKEYNLISNYESVDFIGLMDEKNVSLNRDMNVETENLPCANRMMRTQ